jgi:signal transduction histidine kinase
VIWRPGWSLLGAGAVEPAARTKDGAARAPAPSRQPGLVGFRGKLFASYMSATVVLVVGLASFAQMQVAQTKDQSSEHRRRIVREALEIENTILNASNAQRGFLLTGDRALLEHSQASVPAGFDRRLDDLLELAAGREPYQAELTREIVREARLAAAELERTLDVLRGGEASFAPLRTGADSPSSHQLHADVAALAATVHAERDAEAREASLTARFAKWFIVFGNAIAFILAAAVTFWIGKAFADNQDATRDLAEHGRRLEDHARRLAAQENVLAQRLTQERELTRSLERTNQALARSNADLEQFAYVASHDLRAPLRGIASLGDWLEEDLGPSITTDTKKHLDALRVRVQRLDALVRAIATYSRAGRKEETLESVDVGRLLREVIELSAPPAPSRIKLQSSFPTVTAPRAPLQQIFLNLLSNALKHARPPDGSEGEIGIGWSDDGEQWTFFVTDHGPGVAPEHHQRIFGLFNRLTSQDRVEGTGIGLALVKKLVERHGGRVFVRSALGQGATFGFSWPKDPGNALAWG